jgi:hypothetical protein
MAEAVADEHIGVVGFFLIDGFTDVAGVEKLAAIFAKVNDITIRFSAEVVVRVLEVSQADRKQ